MKRGSIARKKITTTAEFVGSKEEFKAHHIESCLDFTRTDLIQQGYDVVGKLEVVSVKQLHAK
jgi:hypothetical protein